ncbi:DNA helicase RecD, partial [Streptomyces sp. NPDC002454]
MSTHAEAEGSSAQDAPTPAEDDAPTAPDRTAEEDAPADRTPDGGEAAGSATAEGSDEGSEAAAEIAAQREVRERIERRKAEKDGPVDSGAKLSGTAAELLAAVRAVESGERPARSFTPPPPAPEPAAPSRTGPAAAPAEAAGPPAAVVDAVRAVLAAGGAPQSLAAPVAAELGEDAADRLREDPWHLLRVPGVLPEQADGFARTLLGPDCRNSMRGPPRPWADVVRWD